MTTSHPPASNRLAMEIRAGTWRGRTATGGFEIPIQRNAQGNIPDESQEAVVQALNDCIKKHPTRISQVICAVSSGGLLCRTMELPAAADEALKSLVELQIEKEWPLPPEELAWGFQRIEEPDVSDPNGGTSPAKVTVAAIKTSVFRQYKQILAACNLDADWVVGASIGSMLEQITASKTAWLMDLQESRIDLICYTWGIPTAIHSFQSESKDATQNPTSSVSNRALNSMLKTMNADASPGMILLAGEDTHLQKVQKVMQASFPGVPMQQQIIEGTPGTSLITEVLITTSDPQSAHKVIQLESGETKEAPPSIDKLPLIRWGMLLAALIVALFLARRVEPGLKSGKLESQLVQFRGQKKQLPEIDRELSFLQHIQNKSLPYMDLIGLLAAHATPGFQMESIDMGSDHRIQLRGMLQNAHPEDLRAKLLATDWFDQVVLDEQTPDRDGRKVTIRITLLVKDHLKRPKADPTMLGIEAAKNGDQKEQGRK